MKKASAGLSGLLTRIEMTKQGEDPLTGWEHESILLETM